MFRLTSKSLMPDQDNFNFETYHWRLKEKKRKVNENEE
jgi:hypothetical protein